MKLKNYHIEGEENLVSPALIYYRDAIVKNMHRTIELAGGADRLWYHVKTHKTKEIVEMQKSMGITRFMCATISEAEVTASVGVEHILLAYALVGPNIKRFIELTKAFPKTQFWAMGDDLRVLRQLSDAAVEAKLVIPTILDVNVGQDRTGVRLEDVEEFYAECYKLPGINLRGLHCYDGHNHQIDINDRQTAVDVMDEKIENVRQAILARGMVCDTIITGGTPSYPCHARTSNYFLSPGTSFVCDARYGKDHPDLELYEAGAILTRVISHPSHDTFTLDLGSKGISCDQPVRGEIVGVKAKPLFQSEEHWVWKMEEGHESERPEIGSIQYVIPSHICPTTVLYPTILVAENGKLVDEWNVVARGRRLTY
ncbi:MAG: D-TA family PLP-dependent enzyme [Acetivibrionales bacterium]